MSAPTTEFAMRNYCELEGLYFDMKRVATDGATDFVIRPYGYAVFCVCVSADWKLSASIKHIKEAVADWDRLGVNRSSYNG